MGIKKFIETLKNFGDTISSAADGVFDEVNKTFDGLDTSKLTPEQLGRMKRGLILLERDEPKDETDEKD